MYFGRFASLNLTVTLQMKNDLILNGFLSNKY